jgi:hypothetical protein
VAKLNFRNVRPRISLEPGVDGGERMSTPRTTRALLVTGMVIAGTTGSSQAAPLPTHFTAMKSMIATDTVQVRWGGWGGWRGGGWGYRGVGYRGSGYRPYGWGAAAAGALIGGALVSGAYYGSYGSQYGSYGSYYRPYPTYYGGGYSYDYCPPRAGYGYAYSPAYSYGW